MPSGFEEAPIIRHPQRQKAFVHRARRPISAPSRRSPLRWQRGPSAIRRNARQICRGAKAAPEGRVVTHGDAPLRSRRWSGTSAINTGPRVTLAFTTVADDFVGGHAGHGQHDQPGEYADDVVRGRRRTRHTSRVRDWRPAALQSPAPAKARADADARRRDEIPPGRSASGKHLAQRIVPASTPAWSSSMSTRS